jgi:TFIIF-interacting CTD phosphatase-like protein
MALRRHHVIANSPFSWCGARLSNSGGIVVAAKKWFNQDDTDTRDLLPG